MATDTREEQRKSISSFLTLNQTAETLKVSVKTVRRWIVSGELIAHRFGRQLRISNDDLQSFIKLRRQP
jgi:excisionase family DNA binding protein